jgi:hypothetical protein
MKSVVEMVEADDFGVAAEEEVVAAVLVAGVPVAAAAEVALFRRDLAMLEMFMTN